MKNVKKDILKIFTSLIIFLLSFQPLLAVEASPTPAPSPATEPISQVQVANNETTVTTEVASAANTGDNTITPSPTPEPSPAIELALALPSPSPELTSWESSPSPLLTPSPDPSSDPSPAPATNQSSVTESSPDPSPTTAPSPEPSPSANTTVTTADSVAVTEAENKVNTTELNSLIVYKTLNIFVDGDIDLTDSAAMQNLVQESLTQNPDSATVSVSYNGTNIANVSNEIISIAQSGNNSAESGTALINTGNSISIVSLLNQVNTTIIGSQIYLVTINIFGDVTANIILPEFTANNSAAGDGQNISITNEASVSSQINSQANSGQNTLISEKGNGSITTGDAESAVNVTNVVNTTLINTTVSNLAINVLGEWTGDWIGADQWFSLPAYPASAACGNGCTDDIAIANQATVTNDITSLANSGGNTLESKNGQIATGNAYSAVSLFNFINTTIINSRGFWGFINIFGRWNGNVDTANALFADSGGPDQPPTEEFTSSQSSGGEESRETGGLLSVTQSNNVAAYIFPGDTVTFDVIVKNPGGGKVYDSQLWLGLEKDGIEVGGGWIPVGDIPSHNAIKISTGLELSEAAEGGSYTAVTKAVGSVGPDNTEITSEASSTFLVKILSPIIHAAQPLTTPVQAQTENPSNVLGSTIAAGITPYQKILNMFRLLLLLLLLMKVVENRQKLALNLTALIALIKGR